ncbi:MAG: DNA polymerase III subunit beta [Spirochaetes bacterium ADurb.Bin001]|nr:MAG: DNA polymerase III subunit beta [Spirochaetes bacterium ADurb.Bin001]
MKVNKEELLGALERVKPGLSSKELIEQSTSFAFLGDRVVTYNDEISISHPVTGLENMEGAVKAKALYELLARIKSEEVEIIQEKNQVLIKAGRSKAGLLFEQEIRLPIEEIGEIGGWRKLPEKFVEALKLCYPCCSNDMSRPILTCINIQEDKMEASDSYQIIQYKFPKPHARKDKKDKKEKSLIEKPFLIPASSVRDLIKYDIQEISIGENWVHLRTPDDTVFSCRTVEGEFPEVEKFLKGDGDEFTFPEQTKEALTRANVFAKKEAEANTLPAVTVKAHKGELILFSKNEYGWFEEKIKTEKSANFSFSIGIEFLVALFYKLKNCKIESNKIGFSGENWRHVIAIMSNEDGDE